MWIERDQDYMDCLIYIVICQISENASQRIKASLEKNIRSQDNTQVCVYILWPPYFEKNGQNCVRPLMETFGPVRETQRVVRTKLVFAS